MKSQESFQFFWRYIADIIEYLQIIISCEKILKKSLEKHWSAEVPNFLVKFRNTEKFYNSFQKTWEKCCWNVKVRKTWVTLAKSWKNIWKASKKLRRSFEKIGNYFLNKFSTHSYKKCNFRGHFKKLEKTFRENTM